MVCESEIMILFLPSKQRQILSIGDLFFGIGYESIVQEDNCCVIGVDL
jgi:hypothetical protein